MSDIVRDPYGNPLNRDNLITALRAEVERLKAIEADYDDHEREMIDLEEDNIRLVTENKKLRAALEWYASSEAWTLPQLEGPNGDYGNRARAALKEKP